MIPAVPDPFAWFWQIGSFFFGLLLFAAVVIVTVLLVRFLWVGTKAAKLYLASQQSPAPVAPAPVTKPAKTPPAA